MATLKPPVHVIWAAPPGRRPMRADSFPNQVPSPSAVVRAADTASRGWARSTVRSIRSGNPTPHPLHK